MQKLKDINEQVKNIWSTKDIASKLKLSIELVDSLSFQKNTPKLKVELSRCKFGYQIDSIVSNILLSGDGLKVIKTLKK